MKFVFLRAHFDTATGSLLCPKDQPQHARVPKGGEMISTRTPPAEPLRLVLRTQPRSVSPHRSVVVIRCARIERTSKKAVDSQTGLEKYPLRARFLPRWESASAAAELPAGGWPSK